MGVSVRGGRGGARRLARRGARPGGGGDQGQCADVRTGHQHMAAGHIVRPARRGRRRARRRPAGGAGGRVHRRRRSVDRPGEFPDVARHGRASELLHLRSRRPGGGGAAEQAAPDRGAGRRRDRGSGRGCGDRRDRDLVVGRARGRTTSHLGRAAHCGDAVVGDGAGGAARAGLGARRARRHRPLRRAGGGHRAATGLADGDGGGERRELRRRPHRSPQRHRGAHPSRGGSRLGGRCHHFRSHDTVGRHEDRRCLGGGAARTCRSGGRACRRDVRVPRHHR